MSSTQLKDVILDTASTEEALIGKVANGAFLDAGAAVEKAANMVKVTFNDNNGNTKVIYYEKGTTYGDLPVPEREGCTFNAWYNGTTRITENTVVTEGEKYFYANWKATVTFNTPGTAIEPHSVNFFENYSLYINSNMASSLYTRKFLGWKRPSNGVVYKVGDTITGLEGNITLTADWENVYSVLTYHESEFSDEELQEVRYLSSGQQTSDGLWHLKSTALNSLVLPTYIFQGWRIEGGDGTVYSPNNDSLLPGFKSYYLEAVADERAIGAVTFNANGGENTPEQQTVYYHSGTIIPYDEPTKAGYAFYGWATSADGEAEYFPGDFYYAYSQSIL